MAQKSNPYLCMGISRFIGSIFFFLAAYWVFSFLNGAWELDIEKIIDFQGLGFAGYGAMFLSVLAGLIALLIGQGIGASIKIDSDNVATHLTVMWHYLANTTLYWFLASSIVANIMLGNNANSFFQRQVNDFFIRGLIISAIGSQIIVWVMYFGSRIAQRGNPFGILLIKVVPIIIGILMALIHFGGYGITSVIGIVAGILLPFIIIPMSGNMWRKDMLLRDPHL